MELHLIAIFRFIVCLFALIGGLVLMVKADESHVFRFISGGGACLLMYFNETIGNYLYLAVGSTIEALVVSFGVALVVTAGVAVVALPLVLVARKLFGFG